VSCLLHRRENIAGLAASVRESSGTMGRGRQAGEEEHKAVQELVEQRKKEIQVRLPFPSVLELSSRNSWFFEFPVDYVLVCQ
jgi:hypothetical protein